MNRYLIVAGALFALSAALAGCSAGTRHAQVQPSVQQLMIHYGCPTCHVIPGVPGAVGKVGPSLKSLAQRSYLAGTLPNTPENLQVWLLQPQAIHPGTAMPDMPLTAAEAQRIASYLEASR